MNTSTFTRPFWIAKQALSLLAISFIQCIVYGQTGFVEDFTGPTLDPAWVQAGYGAGHLGISGGSYEMTAIQGGGGNPKLQRVRSILTHMRSR